MIKHIPVESLAICSIGYDAETLEVEFHGGGLYRYHHVPQTVWYAFLHSESKGSFHAGQIRDCYPFEKIY